VDHVQITVAEDEGVGTRAGYYEDGPALRDMVRITAAGPLPGGQWSRWSLHADVYGMPRIEVLRRLRLYVADRGALCGAGPVSTGYIHGRKSQATP